MRDKTRRALGTASNASTALVTGGPPAKGNDRKSPLLDRRFGGFCLGRSIGRGGSVCIVPPGLLLQIYFFGSDLNGWRDGVIFIDWRGVRFVHIRSFTVAIGRLARFDQSYASLG